jgi:hypothetical protein
MGKIYEAPGQRKRLDSRGSTWWAPGQRKRPSTTSTQPLSLRERQLAAVIGGTFFHCPDYRIPYKDELNLCESRDESENDRRESAESLAEGWPYTFVK